MTAVDYKQYSIQYQSPVKVIMMLEMPDLYLPIQSNFRFNWWNGGLKLISLSWERSSEGKGLGLDNLQGAYWYAHWG